LISGRTLQKHEIFVENNLNRNYLHISTNTYLFHILSLLGAFLKSTAFELGPNLLDNYFLLELNFDIAGKSFASAEQRAFASIEFHGKVVKKIGGLNTVS
jgi:hypothetical protein